VPEAKVQTTGKSTALSGEALVSFLKTYSQMAIAQSMQWRKQYSKECTLTRYRLGYIKVEKEFAIPTPEDFSKVLYVDEQMLITGCFRAAESAASEFRDIQLVGPYIFIRHDLLLRMIYTRVTILCKENPAQWDDLV